MLKLLLFCTALFFTEAASAGTATRAPDESLENFVLRYAPPNSTIVHKIIESSEWTPHGKMVIAFFEHPYPPPDNDPDLYAQLVTGKLYLPIAARVYEVLEIDSYGPEGRTAQIDSVFFAKADRSIDKALIVLVSWHPNPGDLFRTFAYRKPTLIRPPTQLAPHDIALKLDGGCIYCRKAPVTAAEVKRKLESLSK